MSSCCVHIVHAETEIKWTPNEPDAHRQAAAAQSGGAGSGPLPLSQQQRQQLLQLDQVIATSANPQETLQQAAAANDAKDPRAGILHFEAKVAANEAATKIAGSALKISGGTGYLKKLPIERHFRDAASGQLMAWSTEVTRDFLGKMLLGLPPE